METLLRELPPSGIDRALFNAFIRRQEVVYCLRESEGKLVPQLHPFIDDWTEDDYRALIGELIAVASSGGLVLGAFSGNLLKGFAAADGRLMSGGYADLLELYVSADMRGKGIGRMLFSAAAVWARGKGAKKLYISAHSAVESQAFYKSMGCVRASKVSAAHVAKEPFDIQLEYVL